METPRAGDGVRTHDIQLGKLALYQLSYTRATPAMYTSKEPQIGIEPMTARLRIECSTTELLWRDRAYLSNAPPDHLANFLQTSPHALARTRTAMPFGTSTSSLRVYQFHHEGGPQSCYRKSEANISGRVTRRNSNMDSRFRGNDDPESSVIHA